MIPRSQATGSHPPQPPAPAEYGRRCDMEESVREKGERRPSATVRPPSPLLRVARVPIPQMDSGFTTHTTRHCEGHLVEYTDPLTDINKDGATAILGGAVGPPAAMRGKTAALKRTCSALISEGSETRAGRS